MGDDHLRRELALLDQVQEHEPVGLHWGLPSCHRQALLHEGSNVQTIHSGSVYTNLQQGCGNIGTAEWKPALCQHGNQSKHHFKYWSKLEKWMHAGCSH